jgi:fructose-specific phosphotransferase system IIA component
MLLSELVTPQRIKVPLAATTKDAVITELVDLLAGNGDLKDRDKVLQAVFEREKVKSTGIELGLALPHGKSSGVDDLVLAIGRPTVGVDFQSVDGKASTLIFLLVSPLDKTGPHIQALAKISRLISVNNFRNKLLAANTANELYEAIKANEQIQ